MNPLAQERSAEERSSGLGRKRRARTPHWKMVTIKAQVFEGRGGGTQHLMEEKDAVKGQVKELGETDTN